MQHTHLLCCSLAAAALFTWSPPSSAGTVLEECGSIDLNEDVECEIYVEGGCDVACDPSKFNLACRGQLYAECKADPCDIDLDVDCTASCTVDCAAACELDPGNFSCEGRCEAECDADCDAKCEASGDRTECAASCRATCSGECDVSCGGDPPELNCEAKCAASCEGQCRAEANVDCQVECQADGYLECESDMQEACDVQCKRPEGVVLCDGQFVNAAEVEDCRQAIEAALNIDVKVKGSAEGECSGNECSGEAKGSVSCSLLPANSSLPDTGSWFAVGVAGALFVTRRRRAPRDYK
jgi:hypothetical protein